MLEYDVNSKEQLHNTARELLFNVVMGGSASADSILNDLKMGIDNLKNNWKGKDAGVRIQQLIGVYNGMVDLRDVVAKFAVDASSVVVMYSEIQNANGAQGETFTKLSFESKTKEAPYTDLSDAVKINSMAEAAKRSIDSACNSMEAFKNAFKTKYVEMTENWKAGPGRNNAQNAYETLDSTIAGYKGTLESVAREISNVLANYSM